MGRMAFGADSYCGTVQIAATANVWSRLYCEIARYVNASWLNRRAAASIAVIMLVIAGPATAGSDTGALPAGSTFRDCPNCPEMVVVPAGEFLMGASAAQSERDLAAVSLFESSLAKKHISAEHPQHPVRIERPFGLGRFPVTRGEFAAFVQETGYSPTGGCIFFDNHHYRNHSDGSWRTPGFYQTDRDPVVCVNWLDVKSYTDWLNHMLELNAAGGSNGAYRLPSEAEWEYAARAGQQTARWWGNDIAKNNANCEVCGSLWDRKGTAPEGSFAPNQFGLYDMLGNVWKWTADCWNPDYHGAPANGTAWTSGGLEMKVIRGGSRASSPRVLRLSGRTRSNAYSRDNSIGFRMAKTLP